MPDVVPSHSGWSQAVLDSTTVRPADSRTLRKSILHPRRGRPGTDVTMSGGRNSAMPRTDALSDVVAGVTFDTEYGTQEDQGHRRLHISAADWGPGLTATRACVGMTDLAPGRRGQRHLRWDQAAFGRARSAASRRQGCHQPCKSPPGRELDTQHRSDSSGCIAC